MAAEDAQQWQLQQGDLLTVTVNEVTTTLPVQVVDYLAEGCIGYPVGQSGALEGKMTQATDGTLISFSKSTTMNNVTQVNTGEGV